MALATKTVAYGARRAGCHHSGAGSGRRRHHGRRIGGEGQSDGGQRHGSRDEVVVLPERDVHRPVGAAGLAELAGAVERIDDPDPPTVEASGVLEPFLGQHGVAGPQPGQLGGDEVLRGQVAGVHQLPGVRFLGDESPPHVEQVVARLRCQAGRQLGIGLGERRSLGHCGHVPAEPTGPTRAPPRF